MFDERHCLLCEADLNLNCLREECDDVDCSSIGMMRFNDVSTSNVHVKSDRLQTMMVTFNVLFDVYKTMSIEFHRCKSADFFSVCPTCSDGYLMKTEHQSMIESIWEYLPLNDCLIDFDDEPLGFERMFPGSITFLDNQKGDRNFIHSFMTQEDISRMSSDCDLVHLHYRQSLTNLSCDGQSSILSIRAMPRAKRMKDMLSGLSNKCLNSRTNRLVEAVKMSMDDDSTIQRLDEHLSSDCKYIAFKFSNTSDNDKSKQ